MARGSKTKYYYYCCKIIVVVVLNIKSAEALGGLQRGSRRQVAHPQPAALRPGHLRTGPHYIIIVIVIIIIIIIIIN